MDEMINQPCLEQLGNYIKKRASAVGLEINAEVQDSLNDSESEDEETLDDLNETALEGFTTPIDDEDADTCIDEYVLFKEVITSNLYIQIYIYIDYY